MSATTRLARIARFSRMWGEGRGLLPTPNPRRSTTSSSTLRCDPAMVVISGAGFEDEVERGLGGAAEAAEPRSGRNLAQAPLAGLGAQGRARPLRQRVRHAQQRRG